MKINKRAQAILNDPAKMERLKAKFRDWRIQLLGRHHEHDRVAAYLEMRNRGIAKNIAGILASQRSPGISGTDSQFMEGTGTQSFMDDWSEPVRQHYMAEAKKAGVSTAGKVYKAGLAAYPGDPQAWVGGRDDVLRVCRERNLDCEGMVTHKAVDIAQPEKKPGLAPDLMDRMCDYYRATEQAPKSDAELKEMVLDKHAPKA